MALVRRPDPNHAAARQASREIVLWTTKDGREIPLDEMSDDHIANAIRVLSLWRSRLKKRGSGDPILGEPETIMTKDVLAFAGIAPPTLRVYPIETHVAEKLHAYTMPR